MRPVGGLIIGYTGDKHGRKTALTKSLFLMAVPTTLMGCLPTYESVGAISIVLLVLCRLLPGVSVGGQLPASLVYTVEKRHASQWGFYGSLPMCAANAGTLLGNLCGALLRSLLSEEQLISWGWRIPFFSGILIAFVACYLQVNGTETHTNAGVYDRQDSVIKSPITKACMPQNRMALLATSFTPMLWAAGFYITFVWMAIYMETLVDPPVKGAFWINAMALLLGMTFMLPLAGHLSDTWVRLQCMTVSAVLLAILGPLMVLLIGKGNSFLAFVAQWILGVLLSFFGGPLCAWLVENFSPEVRLTSASLGYDIAHATVGGFSPALATLMYDDVGMAGPGLLYPIFAALSLMGLYIMYCAGGNHLDQTSADLELEQQASDGGDAAEKNLPQVV